MATRNFWLEADIDGRRETVTGGPQAKDGGFLLTVKQRDDGGIVTACKVYGYAFEDGTLELTVQDDKGNTVHKFLTKR